MPLKLGQSLACLMTAQENEEQRSNRSAWIRLSLAQDIVYSVTEGKVKTPKSVLLPTVVKQLTNNTEIINTLNKLGHEVSYSILSEMHTENAYTIQDQQQEDVKFLLNCLKESFTVYVADNIDRKEETLWRTRTGGSRHFEKGGRGRVARLANWLNTPIFVKNIIVYGKRRSNPGCNSVDFYHESLKVLVTLKNTPAIFCGRL